MYNSKKPKELFFIKANFSKLWVICKDCRRFKSFSICRHVPAVAHVIKEKQQQKEKNSSETWLISANAGKKKIRAMQK